MQDGEPDTIIQRPDTIIEREPIPDGEQEYILGPVVFKLYCVDSTITDMYIGLVTSFAEQEKIHENSCIHNEFIAYNQTFTNYVIEHGGWENWIIESIDEPEEIYNQTNDTSRIEKLTDSIILDELVRRNNEFQQTNTP
jgi:hypothetical protein